MKKTMLIIMAVFFLTIQPGNAAKKEKLKKFKMVWIQVQVRMKTLPEIEQIVRQIERDVKRAKVIEVQAFEYIK